MASTSLRSVFTAIIILAITFLPKIKSLSSPRNYDLVVIGGGAAGLTAAKFAATFSKSVIIIERDRMGGDCTWKGCVPSKSLISSASVTLAAAKATKTSGTTTTTTTTTAAVVADASVSSNGGDISISTTAGSTTKIKKSPVKFEPIRESIKTKIQTIYEEDDSPEAMAKLGIDTLLGSATFLTPDTIRAKSFSGSSSEEEELEETIQAKEGVVIATGATAIRPINSIEGLDTISYVTYEEILDFEKNNEELPRRLTVVGGGPIGCELSQALSRLGVTVTMVMDKFFVDDDDVSMALTTLFQKEGITLIQGRATSVQPSSSSSKRAHVLTVTTQQQPTTVEGDLLLVAVGRQPIVHGMGLEELGIELNERGGIQVDKKLKTNIKGIYAAGDCIGDKQFTHYAGYQGAVAARNILLPFSDAGKLDYVPSTTFTDPEIASIGLSEQEAKDLHGSNAISVAIQHVKDIDRAICTDNVDGLIKIIYRTKNYEIIGAVIMAPAAGEMISEIAVAMKTKLSFDMLATVMHTYPSYSVALQIMAGDVYYDKLKRNQGLYDFLKRLGL